MELSEDERQLSAEVDAARAQREHERATLRQAASSSGFEPLGAAGEPASDAEVALRVAADSTQSEDYRIQALQSFTSDISRSPEMVSRLMQLVRDRAQPPALREAAFEVLQISSFRTVRFQPLQAEYRATLRELAGDPVQAIREMALSILAADRDEYAQRILMEGLRGQREALVPPERALQMLAEDFRIDENLPMLRELAVGGSSPEGRQEAVRLMSSYPESRELLTSILQNRGEDAQVRQESAVALQLLAPQEFEEVAKGIAVDDSEDSNLRTTCLTALSQFADPRALATDETFTKAVQQVKDGHANDDLGRAAIELLQKY